MTSPIPPIELTGHADHLPGAGIALPDEFVSRLMEICSVTTDPGDTAEASRDWWPLALHWSLDGEVPRRPQLPQRATAMVLTLVSAPACSVQT